MAKSKKILLIALWGFTAAVVLVWVWFQFLAPSLQRGVADGLGRGDYRLSSTDGGEFTQASLQTGPSAVFFGFTHCPEICPTTLGDLGTWRDAAGKGPDDLKIWFLTVDPERDTLELMGDYVGWLPGSAGVTGTREEIDKAIQAFRVYAARVALDDGDYTMDHSALVLLFDEDGRFFEPIRYQEDFESAVDKIQRLVGS